MNKTRENSIIKSVYDWIETFLLALGFVILIFTFAIKLVTVSGSSMERTLHNYDRLIISDLFYTPKAGDIVVVDVTHYVADPKNSPYIKRVIATQGQVVDIDPLTWTVYVDGKALDEPYVFDNGRLPFMSTGTTGMVRFPYTVPEGHVFVMGDNRNGSSDSRDFGSVHQNYLLGKVLIRIAPEFGGVE